MGYQNKDIPYTSFQGTLVPLPFFEDVNGNIMQVKGAQAPYIQLLGADGLPINISSPMPVHVQGATLTADRLSLENIQFKTLGVTFHDAVTIPGEGTAFTVDAFKTLTVEIYGTSTAREVQFYGKSASGTKRLIQGVNLFDLSMATSTTSKDQIWTFEVTGLESVVMEVVSLTGGNITIKGKAVA